MDTFGVYFSLISKGWRDVANVDKDKPAEISDIEEKVSPSDVTVDGFEQKPESDPEALQSTVDSEAQSLDETPSDPIEDAEILDEASSDTQIDQDAEADHVADDAADPDSDNSKEMPDDDTGADIHAKSEDDLVTDIEDILAESDARSAPEVERSEPCPQVIRETVVEKKAGFVPVLLGGLLAGAVGFGVGQYGGLTDPAESAFETEFRATLQSQAALLDDQSTQIANLIDQLEEAQKAIQIVDPAPLTSAVAGLQDSLGPMSLKISEFESRLDKLEDRLPGDGVVTSSGNSDLAELDELRSIVTAQADQISAAIGAVSAVDDLRAAVSDQGQELAALADRLNQLVDDNAAAEAAAADKAARAETLVALAEVSGALQSGAPFKDALSKLGTRGVEVPAELAMLAEDGAPTQVALVNAFPDLARSALKLARTTGNTDDGASGLGTFFKNQLGARSVTPRDGDDPDAILSRAEAAAATGNLEEALAEVATLPEGVGSIFDEWSALAESRRAALAALDAMTQSVTQE